MSNGARLQCTTFVVRPLVIKDSLLSCWTESWGSAGSQGRSASGVPLSLDPVAKDGDASRNSGGTSRLRPNSRSDTFSARAKALYHLSRLLQRGNWPMFAESARRRQRGKRPLGISTSADRTRDEHPVRSQRQERQYRGRRMSRKVPTASGRLLCKQNTSGLWE